MDDGMFVPKGSNKINTMQVEKKQGPMIITDDPQFPNSIYRIQKHELRIPISNQTDKMLMLLTTEI